MRLALLLLLLSGVTLAQDDAPLEAWYTFPANSPDEALLLEEIAAFEAAHLGIRVKATRIPYLQNLQQFINSSQGGEAPDVVRLSDTEVGKIGHITVEGLPLLEDLRAHLTPAKRRTLEPKSLEALRYDDALLALPVSQGTLTMLYNKRLFDAAGVDYPRDDWTTDDFLRIAAAVSSDDVKGIALPLKWSYWFIPFQTGFGGRPFDEDGNPTLDSPGTEEAAEWFLDLERVHDVVASSGSLEAMSTQFQLEKAAMVIDGPWNWQSYLDAGLEMGFVTLPIVTSTGQRMGPMYSYFGWGVSKQSDRKVDAFRLASWLASDNTQKRYALATWKIPTSVDVMQDEEVLADPVVSAYLRQVRHGIAVPTTRASGMIFEQFDTALHMAYIGEMSMADALAAADNELEKRLAQ